MPKLQILLTPEQRAQFVRIPAQLSERELARHYTFSADDLAHVRRHRGPANRLGFAVQLCTLRFPGRALGDLPEVPERVLAYIAEQVGVPPESLASYGQRENTYYEHLDELRRVYGFQNCGWPQLRRLARNLLPLALESDRAVPLVATALERLRSAQVIAPGMTTVERVVWSVQQTAQRRTERLLTRTLSDEHRARLDGLLHADPVAGAGGDPGLRGRTRLSWLRDAPETASARSLRKVLERLSFLRSLDLPAVDERLHPNRLRQLARRCASYQAQPLTRFAPPRRYALLAAYLDALGPDLVDQCLDIFDKLLGELFRKGERKQEQHFQSNVRALNTSLHVLTSAADALLQAYTDGEDPFAAVFAAVGGQSRLAATVESAKQLVRPEDLDARDLIEAKYSQMRGALGALYAVLDVRAVRGSDPALDALDYVGALAEHSRRVTARRLRVAGEMREAPLGHVTERWRRLVYRGRKHLNPNFYEAAAFEALKEGLRSGDLYVSGSRRYRNFESYLLAKSRWQRLQAAGETRLAVTGTAQEYLQGRRQRIAELLTELRLGLEQEGVGAVTGLTVDKRGELHLAALDGEVPEAARQLQRRLERRLPLICLADLLNEVDLWTGCFGHLTHLSSGEPPDGERKQALLAAVMGLGMNHGLGKMARATPFTYRQLAWAADWHLREETLAKAQATLDNFVLHHPLSRFWGDGTRSSSDGMRVKVAVKAANAERNAEYFHYDRGVTIYTHTADIRLPFAQQVISTNDREALHVIDALCNHETDLQLQEHFVDTHGYTTHVFALCRLLGFRFAPRIRDVLDQRLFTVGAPEDDYGPLNALLKGRVNVRGIEENWDEVLRVAGSIRHGTVSAALLLRKLAAYPRQNQIARALHDIGQLEKTVFILEYLLDPTLRRRVLRGLNNSEAVHSIGRALFVGQRGEFRDRAFVDQVHRASCLHLLIAAIGAWTTPHLADAVEALRAEGESVPDEYLGHLSPLLWDHVNLLGEYRFNPAGAHPLDQRRPLRHDADDEGDEGLTGQR